MTAGGRNDGHGISETTNLDAIEPPVERLEFVKVAGVLGIIGGVL